MKRYVQSIYSDKAEKFLLLTEYPDCWHVLRNDIFYSFLKSEYHEVPAPERWERCGSDVTVIQLDQRNIMVGGYTLILLPYGYRWVWDKQEDGTLVIERKVQP